MRRLIEWFCHPNVIGLVPLPFVKADRSPIAHEDIEDHFPVPSVTCPALDIVQQRATNALAFTFLRDRETVDIGSGVIGEIVRVGLERDEPAWLAVKRRHESPRARLGQEGALSQLSEKSVEGFRVSRGGCLTWMHPGSDPGQERLVIGAIRAYRHVNYPRLGREFRRHPAPPDWLGGRREAFPPQPLPRYPDLSLQRDRK
jgi:hypothetical protein